ncbi:MAG: BON domain-containing protein [Pirellulaceae bacterium]
MQSADTSSVNLADEIQMVFVHHAHHPLRKIHVNVGSHGNVCLTGRVRTFFEKQMAQESVRHINGVANLENQIIVET